MKDDWLLAKTRYTKKSKIGTSALFSVQIGITVRNSHKVVHLDRTLKVRGYPEKNPDTVYFRISQDKYLKRAYQEYTNDVRIIISTSLNFAQFRKNGPKRPKLQFLESAQPAPKKRLELHKK